MKAILYQLIKLLPSSKTKGLITHPGQYRKTGIGIVKGNELTHVAPPAKNIPYLMKDLFEYVKKAKTMYSLKAAFFIMK